MSLEFSVQYATREPWVPARNLIALWAYGTLLHKGDTCDLSVRVVGNAESKRFNSRYRHKDKPTNVLAFPGSTAVEGRRQLGDLVICAPVVAREAKEQGKSRHAHWAHMIVHGTLHLLGYDHMKPAEARRMERRETAILKSLGYDNPYLSKA